MQQNKPHHKKYFFWIKISITQDLRRMHFFLKINEHAKELNFPFSYSWKQLEASSNLSAPMKKYPLLQTVRRNYHNVSDC